MSIGTFLDKDTPPSSQDILAALGSRQALWKQLDKFLQESYDLPGDLNYGGKNYGWNLRYRKGGKTLLVLFPQQGYCVAQVILGKAEVEQALRLKLGKNVRTCLVETPQLHDGRWLFIKVKAARDVKDVQQLLLTKRRPKARPEN
jgi:hypothetical protein